MAVAGAFLRLGYSPQEDEFITTQIIKPRI
jgi:hypothetical protein